MLLRNSNQPWDEFANPRENANKILEEIKRIYGYTSASVQLILGDTRLLLTADGFNPDEADRGLLIPVSHDPLISRVVEGREPLILEQTTSDPHWEVRESTKRINSWVGIPIIFDGKLIGLVTLDHTQAGYYKKSIKESLYKYASAISPRIWNVSLWNSAQRLIRDMEIVHEVVKHVGTKLDIKDILRTIAAQIAIRLSCSRCAIFFHEQVDGRPMLVPQIAYEGKNEKTLRRVFRSDEGLAGKVFTKGESIVVFDTMREEGFVAASEIKNEPRSMLVAPLKIGNQTIGVISVDQDTRGGFNESDRLLVDALAQQAGIAIQRSQELKLLQDIGNRINSFLKVDEILREMIEGAIRLTHTSTGVIYLISEDGKSVQKSYYPDGFEHPAPRMDQENGLTRTVINTGRPVEIPDINKEPTRVHPKLRGRFQSTIAMPLIVRNKVIGVFYLNDEKPRNFNDTERSFLSTLATQAALAIQNAKRISMLKGFEEFLKNLIIKEQDQEGALANIACGIREILGEGVSPTINLYDEDTDRFGSCHAYGPLANELQESPRDIGGTGRYVLRSRLPLYINDVHNPPKGCPTIRQRSIDLGVCSFAAIPLKRQSNIFGVLFINSQVPIYFDDEFKRLLAIFASQAATAIEIARFNYITKNYGPLAKAADLGFLASGIAHQFNNSLQNIRSILYQIRCLDVQEEHLNLLERIEQQISQAVETINRFRNIRDQRSSIERINIAMLFRDLIDISRIRARDHGIDITINEIDRCEIDIDVSFARAVLLNLIPS